MLIFSWIWNSYPFRLRSKGFQIWPYSQLQQSGYLLQPGLFMMPSTCSTRLLYWNYAEQFACNLIFKTSFSRLNPGPRGQATVIRSPIRRHSKVSNNRRSRATSFLPTSSPSTISGRLGHPWFLRNWARTSGRTQHLEASRSIFSSRYMQNRHQA